MAFSYLQNLLSSALPVLPYDSAAVLWHGEQRARLEACGLRPGFADGQIATIAAAQGGVTPPTQPPLRSPHRRHHRPAPGWRKTLEAPPLICSCAGVCTAVQTQRGAQMEMAVDSPPLSHQAPQPEQITQPAAANEAPDPPGHARAAARTSGCSFLFASQRPQPCAAAGGADARDLATLLS